MNVTAPSGTRPLPLQKTLSQTTSAVDRLLHKKSSERTRQTDYFPPRPTTASQPGCFQPASCSDTALKSLELLTASFDKMNASRDEPHTEPDELARLGDALVKLQEGVRHGHDKHSVQAKLTQQIGTQFELFSRTSQPADRRPHAISLMALLDALKSTVQPQGDTGLARRHLASTHDALRTLRKDTTLREHPGAALALQSMLDSAPLVFEFWDPSGGTSTHQRKMHAAIEHMRQATPASKQWTQACRDLEHLIRDAERSLTPTPKKDAKRDKFSSHPGIGSMHNLAFGLRKFVVSAGGTIAKNVRTAASPSIQNTHRHNTHSLAREPREPHHRGLTPEMTESMVNNALLIFRNSPLSNTWRTLQKITAQVISPDDVPRTVTQLIADSFDLSRPGSAINQVLQRPEFATRPRSLPPASDPRHFVQRRFVQDLTHEVLDQALKLTPAALSQQGHATWDAQHQLRQARARMQHTVVEETQRRAGDHAGLPGLLGTSDERRLAKQAHKEAREHFKAYRKAVNTLKKELGALPGFDRDTDLAVHNIHASYYEKLLTPGRRAGVLMQLASACLQLAPAGARPAAQAVTRLGTGLVSSTVVQDLVGQDAASAVDFHKKADYKALSQIINDPTTEKLERQFIEACEPVTKILGDLIQRESPRMVNDGVDVVRRMDRSGLEAVHHADLYVLSLLDRDLINARGTPRPDMIEPVEVEQAGEHIATLLYRYKDVLPCTNDAQATIEALQQAIVARRQAALPTGAVIQPDWNLTHAQINHMRDSIQLTHQDLAARHPTLAGTLQPLMEFLRSRMDQTFGSEASIAALRTALTISSVTGAVSTVGIGIGTAVLTGVFTAKLGPAGGVAASVLGSGTQYFVTKLLHHYVSGRWSKEARGAGMQAHLFTLANSAQEPTVSETANHLAQAVKPLTSQRLNAVREVHHKAADRSLLKSGAYLAEMGAQLLGHLTASGYADLAGVPQGAFKLRTEQMLAGHDAPERRADQRHAEQLKSHDVTMEALHRLGLELAGQSQASDATVSQLNQAHADYLQSSTRSRVKDRINSHARYLPGDNNSPSESQRALSDSLGDTIAIFDAYLTSLPRGRGAQISLVEWRAMCSTLLRVGRNVQVEDWIVRTQEALNREHLLEDSDRALHLRNLPRAGHMDLDEASHALWNERVTFVRRQTNAAAEVLTDLYLLLNGRTEETIDRYGIVDAYLQEQPDVLMSMLKKHLQQDGIFGVRAVTNMVSSVGLQAPQAFLSFVFGVVVSGFAGAATKEHPGVKRVFAPDIFTMTVDGQQKAVTLPWGATAAATITGPVVALAESKVMPAKFGIATNLPSARPGLTKETASAAASVIDLLRPKLEKLQRDSDTVSLDSMLTGYQRSFENAGLREYGPLMNGLSSKTEAVTTLPPGKGASVAADNLQEMHNTRKKLRPAPVPVRMARWFTVTYKESVQALARMRHNMYRDELAAYLRHLGRQGAVQLHVDANMMEPLFQELGGRQGPVAVVLSDAARDYLRRADPGLLERIVQMERQTEPTVTRL